MNDSDPQTPAHLGVIRRRRVAIAIPAGISVLVLLGFVWLVGSVSRNSDAEITAGSPIRNVHSDVGFVGDAKCARCHPEISQTYREHPMGRSLTEVMHAQIPPSESDPKPFFKAQGLEYSVERRGDKLIHTESRKDAEGRLVAKNKVEARFVIGSGEQALAFVLDRGGYLFQSPITYYNKKKTWDLSPGYEADNVHFERFVKTPCLFCHANRFDQVAGTENRYREPIFQGHAIGCERCHGPGELHVNSPNLNDPASPNIVNPSRLEPSLRESVCQQCHLQGDIRVVRAGRKLEEYRPGLPLHRFESIFVKGPSQGKKRFFGQVEQMYESRCFLASGGKMGCISCHDPHELPSEAEKVEYYNGRCMECHAEKGCKVPREQRLVQSRDDSCIHCHMPRSPNEQVPHTATTLHLIPRFASSQDSAEPTSLPGREEYPLVNFYDNLLNPKERVEAKRDLGIALTEKSRAFPGINPQNITRLALPLIEGSLKVRPDDPTAWFAKGNAQWDLGLREASLSSFRKALEQAPDREELIVAVGVHAAQKGKNDEALAHLKKAIAINPWRSDYHHALALVYTKLSDWPNAMDSARKAANLNPFSVGARMILVQSLLKNHQNEEAKAEFRTLLDCDPPNPDTLRDWFSRNSAP